MLYNPSFPDFLIELPDQIRVIPDSQDSFLPGIDRFSKKKKMDELGDD
jgi:hypothetical protein